MDKAITFCRNEEGQTYALMTGLEPSSNTPYSAPIPASYMLSGKRDTEPQLQTRPSDRKLDEESKLKQEPCLSFLTAGPHRKN